MLNLALFDLDHTLIPIDSGYEWCVFMINIGVFKKKKFIKQNNKFFLEYRNGTLNIDEYLNITSYPLAKYSRIQLNAWHNQYMNKIINPVIYKSAINLVKKHKKNGDLCCIVTATNKFIAEPIAKIFKIDALIACELETIDGLANSNYTGKPIGIPSYKEGKVLRTEEWLKSIGKTFSDFKNTYFYTDSYNDMPLLKKVIHPVAINSDKKLRMHALSCGWKIIDIFNNLMLK